MADQLDSMSDAELQTKLSEYGFPVMPITASTRNLLVKKLKQVLDNKRKQRNKDSAQYSSSMDSDLDVTNNARERRGRRVTTGGVMLPPSFIERDANNGSKVDSMADQLDLMSDAELQTKLSEHGFPVMPITASTRNLLVKKLKQVLDNKRKPRNSENKDESSHSSNMDSDLDTTNNAKKRRGHRGGACDISSTLPTNDETISLPDSSIFTRPSISPDFSTSLSSSDHLNSIRKRLGLTNTLGDQISSSTYTPSFIPAYQPSTSTVDEDESPYLSNFTRRLAALKADPPKPTSFSDRDANNGSKVESMADQLDLMSEAELQTKLAEHGFPVMPKTASTRKLLVKKLKLVLDAKGKPRNSVDSKVDSDLDTTNNTRETRDRRVTTGGAMLPPSFIDSDANNGSTVLPRKSYITGVSRREVVDYKTTNDRKLLENYRVPLAMVVLVASLFFCFNFKYIVQKNDITSVVNNLNSVIPICQLNIPGNKPGINCVPKEEVNYAKDLLQVIYPELTSRAKRGSRGGSWGS